ncbi:MAG: hypothetical protein IIZ56_03315, partial [Clostridia bacterium]|nr:hypothetical protein [Clostridia bacterium]
MKKNWITKVAVLMLALVMVTSCFVGSTFAKYDTRAEGQDNARVAKWGVLVSVAGNAFATEYAAEDEAYTEDGGTLAVKASNEDQVVAPGTSSEEVGDELVASVKGTPEVATRYILEGKAVKDVVLPAGTYTDYTHLVKADDGSYGYTDKFTLAKDYAPVKWNLTIEGKGQTLDVATALYDNLPPENLAQAEAYGLTREGCSIFDAITIIQKVAGNPGYTNIVEAALGQIVSGGRNFQLEADKEAGTFKLSYDFDPNKEMDFTFTLSWAWAFENGEEIKDDEGNGTGIYEFDAADTYLGNVAAGVVTDDNASTILDATFVATATQI